MLHLCILSPWVTLMGSDTDLLHWFKRVPLRIKCPLFNKNPQIIAVAHRHCLAIYHPYLKETEEALELRASDLIKHIFPGSPSTGKMQLSPAQTTLQQGDSDPHCSRRRKRQEETRKSSNSKDGARLGVSPIPEFSWFDCVTCWVPSAPLSFWKCKGSKKQL